MIHLPEAEVAATCAALAALAGDAVAQTTVRARLSHAAVHDPVARDVLGAWIRRDRHVARSSRCAREAAEAGQSPDGGAVAPPEASRAGPNWTTAHPSQSHNRIVHAQSASRAETYRQALERGGLTLPQRSWAAGGLRDATIDWQQVSAESGIKIGSLRPRMKWRVVIESWIPALGLAERELRRYDGPGGNPEWSGANRTLDRGEREAKLTAYLQRLREQGLPLPEQVTLGGGILWRKVAEESGLSLNCFHAAGGRMRRIVERWAPELGTGPRRSASLGDPLSIEELEMVLDIEQPRLLRRRGLDDKAVRKAMSNLHWAFRIARIVAGDLVGAPARPAFETLAADAGTKATVRTEARRCLNALDEIEHGDGLPASYSAAFALVCARSGKSTPAIAAMVGLTERALRNRIESEIGSNTLIAEAQKFERLFGLPPACLSSRLTERRRRTLYVDRSMFDADIVDEATYLKIRKYVPPEFTIQPAEARRAMLIELLAELDQQTSAYSRAMRIYRQTPYRMTAFSEALASEWNDFIEFQNTLARRLDIHRRGGKWSDATVLIRKERLHGYFGSLCILASPDDPAALVPHMALALALFPKCARAHLEHMARRKALAWDGDMERLTGAEFHILGDLQRLVETETGWLRQRPDLGDRLRPVYGLVSQEEIDTALADWDGACDRAERGYKREKRSLRSFVEELCDRHEAVLPFLKQANPAVAFATLMEGLAQDIEKCLPGTRERAIALRSGVLVGILSQLGLRLGTLCALNAQGAHTHIMKVDGVWTLRISRHLFKNKNGPYFGDKDKGFHDYEEELDDSDGLGLYAMLDEYLLEGGREALNPKGVADALFPGIIEGKRMRKTAIRNLIIEITRRFLAYNPLTKSGVKGVRPFGPHPFRHILATAVLKATGDKQTAADAIHDAVDTIERYVRYLPSDRRDTLKAARRSIFSSSPERKTSANERSGKPAASPSISRLGARGRAQTSR
ncbi:hypothetical protein [Chenggangzhangella methanolivorans]|uniref:Uncharacterized protein n=1 Tax=Chenggangzhangella methanolivorans TaxID=1437009 RepID=A0A9E6R982_9HYPH|nr:hypothetical protein [Chenggangzhangella methanolivorans]QZO00533.1 hypothetical protein K6K41_02035 [Chenggangzhangella methanolivorans]